SHLRHRLEALHGKQDPTAIETAWPHLSNEDRWIRWAARIVLEHQPLASWKDKALAEKNPAARLEALLAAARLGGVCPTHRKDGHVVDTALREELLAALLAMDFQTLGAEQQLGHVRISQIITCETAPKIEMKNIHLLDDLCQHLPQRMASRAKLIVTNVRSFAVMAHRNSVEARCTLTAGQ
ncbi:MAG: hypothetical protein HC777_03125, partial [Hyphomonadaceae bacterium]|nr:hypothetical protein [Hyphomonadaceae bacterium]